MTICTHTNRVFFNFWMKNPRFIFASYISIWFSFSVDFSGIWLGVIFALDFAMRVFRFIIALLGVFGFTMAMTRQQLKKSLGIMKNQCLTKTGATEDKVNNIDQGVFIEEKPVMCYIACIYKSVQVVKKDRLDGDLISKQIDMLYPQEMRETVKKGVAKCMPVQDNYNDMCEGIFYSTRCLYEYDPKSFVFA